MRFREAALFFFQAFAVAFAFIIGYGILWVHVQEKAGAQPSYTIKAVRAAEYGDTDLMLASLRAGIATGEQGQITYVCRLVHIQIAEWQSLNARERFGPLSQIRNNPTLRREFTAKCSSIAANHALYD